MKTSKQQITRAAAYALILHDDCLVLCRCSSRWPDIEKQWTLPGGGLEFGEDPADAMVREVREETGLTVRAIDIAGIDSNLIHLEGNSYHGIRIIYNVHLLSGELRNEVGGSTDQCAWFTQDQANDLQLVDLARTGLSLAFPPV